MASRENVAYRRAVAINTIVEILSIDMPRKYGNELSQVILLESIVSKLQASTEGNAIEMALQGIATANLEDIAAALDISTASAKKISDRAKQQLAKV